MKEHISELSPEEFQKTFPIELKDVIADYTEWYEEEKDRILSVLSENDVVRTVLFDPFSYACFQCVGSSPCVGSADCSVGDEDTFVSALGDTFEKKVGCLRRSHGDDCYVNVIILIFDL